MCLAVPGKILEIHGTRAIADFGGILRKVDISLLDGCTRDDYILVHVGYAIQKVEQTVAKEAYRLLDDLDKEASGKGFEDE